jgi:hypothetical protein
VKGFDITAAWRVGQPEEILFDWKHENEKKQMCSSGIVLNACSSRLAFMILVTNVK